jgi:hypothetical protein
MTAVRRRNLFRCAAEDFRFSLFRPSTSTRNCQRYFIELQSG